jgi:hypothetical protein
VKDGKIRGHFVTERQRTRREVPVRARAAAGLDLHHERSAPDVFVREALRDGFQQLDAFHDAGEDREARSGFAIAHADIRARLRRAHVVLEKLVPRPFGIAEVALAAAAAIFRKCCLLGKTREFFRIGADHIADDLIGALPVETMRVVKDQRHALHPVAAIAVEPAFRGLHEHTFGELVLHREHHDGRISIRGIFLAPQNRQSHLMDLGVSDFMQQHEQQVADDEPNGVAALRIRAAAEHRFVLEQLR